MITLSLAYEAPVIAVASDVQKAPMDKIFHLMLRFRFPVARSLVSFGLQPPRGVINGSATERL